MEFRQAHDHGENWMKLSAPIKFENNHISADSASFAIYDLHRLPQQLGVVGGKSLRKVVLNNKFQLMSALADTSLLQWSGRIRSQQKNFAAKFNKQITFHENMIVSGTLAEKSPLPYMNGNLREYPAGSFLKFHDGFFISP